MTILEYLFAHPKRFSLGEAIRLLAESVPTSDPLAGGDYHDAVIQIRQRLSSARVDCDVDAVVRRDDGGFAIYTSVLNVGGSRGELDYNRGLTREPKLRPFDLVTHELVARWYRDWSRRRPSSAAARVRPRSALGFEAYLRTKVDVPVRVRDGVAGYSVVGGRIRADRHHRLSILLGPLTWTQLQRHTPGTTAYRRLQRAARRYLGPAPGVELVLRLQAGAARPCEYGSPPDRGYILAAPGMAVPGVDAIIPPAEFEEISLAAAST